MSGKKSVGHYLFAGLNASLISIGLARFAYTPLLPELIQADWFAASDAAYLGAANLAGYLIGAMLGRKVGSKWGSVFTLQIMMSAATIAFFACAVPISIVWYFIWRLLSGIAGGMIMVLVASVILPFIPVHRRHLASGAIFLGIGIGIFASATLIPFLLKFGLTYAWIGLGIFSTLLTLVSWNNFPQAGHCGEVIAQARLPKTKLNIKIQCLFVQYGLMAISIVAPAVFLVDFLNRGMHLGGYIASICWGLYGIGSMFGPPLYGVFADYFGSKRVLQVVLFIQFVALLMLTQMENIWLMGGVAFVIGTFPPGIVPLMLARIHDSVSDVSLQNIYWSRATIYFASSQAIAGYVLSAIFNMSGNEHRLLFFVGGGALFLALLLEISFKKLKTA